MGNFGSMDPHKTRLREETTRSPKRIENPAATFYWPEPDYILASAFCEGAIFSASFR